MPMAFLTETEGCYEPLAQLNYKAVASHRQFEVCYHTDRRTQLNSITAVSKQSAICARTLDDGTHIGWSINI